MSEEAMFSEVAETGDEIVTLAAPLYRHMDTLSIAKRLGVTEAEAWNRLERIKLASEELSR